MSPRIQRLSLPCSSSQSYPMKCVDARGSDPSRCCKAPWDRHQWQAAPGAPHPWKAVLGSGSVPRNYHCCPHLRLQWSGPCPRNWPADPGEGSQGRPSPLEPQWNLASPSLPCSAACPSHRRLHPHLLRDSSLNQSPIQKTPWTELFWGPRCPMWRCRFLHSPVEHRAGSGPVGQYTWGHRSSRACCVWGWEAPAC